MKYKQKTFSWEEYREESIKKYIEEINRKNLASYKKTLEIGAYWDVG